MGPPQSWRRWTPTLAFMLLPGASRTPGARAHLSLVHFTAGAGSPTALHGSRTSFIQGVVTVPPKEMIFAGAARDRG